MLISIVLLQHGKGADLGAAFGGSGNTLFGATGADNILTRTTTLLAIIFMSLSIVLAVHARDNVTSKGDVVAGGLFKDLPETASTKDVEKSEIPETATKASEAKAPDTTTQQAKTSNSAQVAVEQQSNEKNSEQQDNNTESNMPQQPAAPSAPVGGQDSTKK